MTTSNRTKQLTLENKLSNLNTNNTLHFFISLFTAGIWLPFWGLFLLSNHMERASTIKKLVKLEEA